MHPDRGGARGPSADTGLHPGLGSRGLSGRKNSSEFIEQLKQTDEPVVPTINGKAEVVIQDAASYQRLREAVEEATAIEAKRQGFAGLDAGRTMSLDDFRKHAAARHGIKS